MSLHLKQLSYSTYTLITSCSPFPMNSVKAILGQNLINKYFSIKSAFKFLLKIIKVMHDHFRKMQKCIKKKKHQP